MNDKIRKAANSRNNLEYCDRLSEKKILEAELAGSTAPFSPDEEREAFRDMVRAAVEGDEKRRLALRDRIFIANMRLALKEAAKIFPRRWRYYGDCASSLLDLVHVAYLAIYNAVDKFNVDSDNRFSTYATTAIRHAINEADGIRKRHEHGVGPMERLDDSNDRDGAWRWLEQQGDGDSDPIPDEVDSNGRREWLVDGLRRLTPRESDFLSAKFGLGGCDCHVADIARKYGISQARATQIVQAGIKKLRRHVAA